MTSSPEVRLGRVGVNLKEGVHIQRRPLKPEDIQERVLKRKPKRERERESAQRCTFFLKRRHKGRKREH